ncbi:hypothetical protein VNO78_20582 [Psophocarpus tetragonolobus]|uniref:Uncharacterized protein n=1 Tax=Psophocarpus tetragonolobus TaxID=3891 RepID=A0AAN9XGV7_PSOTE
MELIYFCTVVVGIERTESEGLACDRHCVPFRLFDRRRSVVWRAPHLHAPLPSQIYSSLFFLLTQILPRVRVSPTLASSFLS